MGQRRQLTTNFQEQDDYVSIITESEKKLAAAKEDNNDTEIITATLELTKLEDKLTELRLH